MGEAQATGFYRFEAKIISRGGGRSLIASAAYRTGGKSATSAAAYRAGVQLTDERSGISYDYTHKRGIMGAEILLPNGAPAWMKDRAKLWNAVEASEKRKDAQTARDYLLSLPHQLSPEQRRALTKWFVAEQFTSKGYVADIAWHSPDSREGLNHHAHVMVTMRRLDGDGFARTKDRAPAGLHPMKVWKDELLRLREAWAHAANRFLEAAGLDVRITHESLKSRGIEQEPDPKLGPVAMHMERNGRESYAGRDRRDAAARNTERAELKVELAKVVAEEAQLVDLVTRRLRSGQMTREPPTDEELRQLHEAELDRLAELQRQEARDTFKRQAEQAAEEAQKYKEQTLKDDDRRQSDGEIASASARYSVALADHYSVTDAYGSLARAAMSDYGAFIKGQEQLRQQIAKEPDADKRRVIELRKAIEGQDWMALTSDRLGGISASIGGRPDAPQAILHYARAEMYTAQATELRGERAAAMGALRDRDQHRRHEAEARTADPVQAKTDPSEHRTPAAKDSDTRPAALDPREAMTRATELAQRAQQAQTAQPGQPAAPGQVAPISRRDEQAADQRRAKITGKTEGDAELSDEQRALLSELHEARAAITERAAARKKDRDRGGGGRSGR